MSLVCSKRTRIDKIVHCVRTRFLRRVCDFPTACYGTIPRGHWWYWLEVAMASSGFDDVSAVSASDEPVCDLFLLLFPLWYFHANHSVFKNSARLRSKRRAPYAVRVYVTLLNNILQYRKNDVTRFVIMCNNVLAQYTATIYSWSVRILQSIRLLSDRKDLLLRITCFSLSYLPIVTILFAF